MPFLLMLALGASIYFIGAGVVEAAKREPCSEEVMRNLVLTGIAIFKQRVDGIQRVSAEAEAQAKQLSQSCHEQLVAFLDRNPQTAAELKKAQEAFLSMNEDRLLRKRDELFAKLKRK